MLIGEQAINSREFKYFCCHRCKAVRADFEVFGIGNREYCLFPDHAPRFRIYRLYGKWHIWIKRGDAG